MASVHRGTAAPRRARAERLRLREHGGSGARAEGLGASEASAGAVGLQAKAEIGFALTGGQGSGRAREVGGTLAVVAWQVVGKALGLARHRAVCVWPPTLLC